MTVWKRCLFVAPAIGAALMPKIVCPICWPLYAGVLSAFGVGFVPSTAYLLPLTGSLLFIAVGTLWYGAKKKSDYRPFFIGLVGGAFVMVGKFAAESSFLVYSGTVLFVAGAVWNAWPKSTSCSACAPEQDETNKERAFGGNI